MGTPPKDLGSLTDRAHKLSELSHEEEPEMLDSTMLDDTIVNTSNGSIFQLPHEAKEVHPESDYDAPLFDEYILNQQALLSTGHSGGKEIENAFSYLNQGSPTPIFDISEADYQLLRDATAPSEHWPTTHNPVSEIEAGPPSLFSSSNAKDPGHRFADLEMSHDAPIVGDLSGQGDGDIMVEEEARQQEADDGEVQGDAHPAPAPQSAPQTTGVSSDDKAANSNLLHKIDEGKANRKKRMAEILANAPRPKLPEGLDPQGSFTLHIFQLYSQRLPSEKL
jgi:hypothetical protein